jgi:hypothetical protein
MKKVFKVLLLIVVCLVAIVLIGAIAINVRGVPKYEAKKIDLKIEYTHDRIENGTRLASMLCRSCHYNDETQTFSGREMTEVNQFGKSFRRILPMMLMQV